MNEESVRHPPRVLIPALLAKGNAGVTVEQVGLRTDAKKAKSFDTKDTKVTKDHKQYGPK